MSIPQEALDSRQYTVTDETSLELIQEIKDYNIKMNDCRAKQKSIRNIKAAVIALNAAGIAMSFILELSKCCTISPGMIACAICAISLFVLGLRFDKYLYNSIVCIIMVAAGVALLPFVVANIGLSYYYQRIRDPFAKEPDYPKFREIHLIYEQHVRIRPKKTADGGSVLEDINESMDIGELPVRREEEDEEEIIEMPEI